ncbi:UNVERIFIED_CONTAM: hypothetical protein Sindi_1851000, partial [Sesamum indicum]
MALRKHKHTQIPVWIRLRHLPVECWTSEGLSAVTSGVGKPLYPDAITRACTRLNFARVCVMLDISSKLPKHVVLLMPMEEGAEIPYKVDVEYEWLPLKCRTCMSLDHDSKTCPTIKKLTQNVKIFVQRPLKEKVIGKEIDEVEPPPAREAEPHGRGDIRHIISRDGGLNDGGDLRGDVSSKTPPNMKGKEIVLYNTFSLLIDEEMCAATHPEGPNGCSPSMG